MSEPVVLAAVFLNSLRHAVRDRNLVAQRNYLLGSFEYLYENAGESILAWVIEGAMILFTTSGETYLLNAYLSL